MTPHSPCIRLDTNYFRNFFVAPSAPPSNIRVTAFHSQSLLVSWLDVPTEHRNGIIRGYRLTYTNVSNRTGPVITERAYSVVLTQLSKATEYRILLWAFNSAGDGVSGSVVAKTGEDGRFKNHHPPPPPAKIILLLIKSWRSIFTHTHIYIYIYMYIYLCVCAIPITYWYRNETQPVMHLFVLSTKSTAFKNSSKKPHESYRNSNFLGTSPSRIHTRSSCRLPSNLSSCFYWRPARVFRASDEHRRWEWENFNDTSRSGTTCSV